MNALSDDLVGYILQFVDDPIPCKFVCKTWRILSTQTYLLPSRDEYIEFLFLSGQLKLMKWMIKGLNCSWAVKRNRLDMLMWLRANNISWGPSTCTHAAHNGNLEMLEWLYLNDAPWWTFTCNAAAANGHLHILKWAHKNAIPWDRKACIKIAKKNENAEMIEWLDGATQELMQEIETLIDKDMYARALQRNLAIFRL